MTNEGPNTNNIDVMEQPIQAGTGANGKEQLLNHIMLDLQIEVGRTKIKIADLMELDEGSVVELEQNSQDPIIIYANDKPIAKGQIISSNGKYNIRIL